MGPGVTWGGGGVFESVLGKQPLSVVLQQRHMEKWKNILQHIR